MQIEARRADDAASRWFASFARVGSGETTVRRGQTVVWSVKEIRYFEHNPQASYYTAWGEDPIPE